MAHTLCEDKIHLIIPEDVYHLQDLGKMGRGLVLPSVLIRYMAMCSHITEHPNSSNAFLVNSPHLFHHLRGSEKLYSDVCCIYSLPHSQVL